MRYVAKEMGRLHVLAIVLIAHLPLQLMLCNCANSDDSVQGAEIPGFEVVDFCQFEIAATGTSRTFHLMYVRGREREVLPSGDIPIEINGTIGTNTMVRSTYLPSTKSSLKCDLSAVSIWSLDGKRLSNEEKALLAGRRLKCVLLRDEIGGDCLSKYYVSFLADDVFLVRLNPLVDAVIKKGGGK